MRIIHQLLIATIFPAILIRLMGIYATGVSETSLRNAIEQSAMNLTELSTELAELTSESARGQASKTGHALRAIRMVGEAIEFRVGQRPSQR